MAMTITPERTGSELKIKYVKHISATIYVMNIILCLKIVHFLLRTNKTQKTMFKSAVTYKKKKKRLN